MASNNRQLGINLIASVTSYVITYAISFILTPYIIKELGVEAFGFVGLSNQIIGYSSLITIALNSMAGRFVTIEYHKGNIEKANRYFSSVFLTNCIISLFLFLLSCFLVLYLENVLNIPNSLIIDVKLLFAYLAFNSILGLLTNVFAVSTFIKNRLDYSNVRNIIGNILRAVLLVVLYSLLSPKVWYFGVAGLVSTVYVAFTNFKFCKKLTPELCVKKELYDIQGVKELVSAGIWNLITKLSTMLESGFNLLIANLFVGPTFAGVYTLSTTVPLMINSICSMMAGNFAPEWTQLFALGKVEELKHEILKSIRIMGFLASIPIAVFVTLGKLFYKLWVPSQDATLLYWLSIVGSIVMVFAMPLEPLWNIFTVTNKVKKSSLNLLEWSIATFAGVLVGMFITDNMVVKLFIIAAVKSIFGSIRTLTFLPIYGAKCLGYANNTFYPPIFKNLLCLFIIILLSSLISYIVPQTWLGLFFGIVLTSIIGVCGNWLISLNNKDRKYIIQILATRIKR